MAVTAEKTRWTRFGIPGQSDCYAIVRGGRLIEIEIKNLNGRLSPEQEAWRNFCEGWRVPWLLLKPLKGEATEVTVGRWCEEIQAISLTWWEPAFILGGMSEQ